MTHLLMNQFLDIRTGFTVGNSISIFRGGKGGQPIPAPLPTLFNKTVPEHPKSLLDSVKKAIG